MLYAAIAGVGLLVGLMLILNWFSTAEPRQVLRVLKRVALLVVLGAIILLLVTGRLGWALAGLAALAPWAGRLLRLLMFGHMARSAFSGLGGNPFGGMRGSGSGAKSAQGASTVSSQHLEMNLDHATGRMDGTVLDGPFEGRSLSSLSQDEALSLWHAVGDDPDSIRLLEAWLDRAYPDWRSGADDDGATGSRDGRKASTAGTMSRQEALEVLGLDDGATDADVRTAYRRLMARAHPDQGGSTWMAAKLNEARAVLLGNAK